MSTIRLDVLCVYYVQLVNIVKLSIFFVAIVTEKALKSK